MPSKLRRSVTLAIGGGKTKYTPFYAWGYSVSEGRFRITTMRKEWDEIAKLHLDISLRSTEVETKTICSFFFFAPSIWQLWKNNRWFRQP